MVVVFGGGEDASGRDADIFRHKTFHFAVGETPMTLYDVYNADEAFLTGSGAELIPTAEVDGRRLLQAPGLVFNQLKQAFIEKTQEMA